MTLAVILLIFLIGKSRQVKELGKLGGRPESLTLTNQLSLVCRLL